MAEKVLSTYTPRREEAEAALKLRLTPEQKESVEELLRLLDRERKLNMKIAHLRASVEEFEDVFKRREEINRLYEICSGLLEVYDRQATLKDEIKSDSEKLKSLIHTIREENRMVREKSAELKSFLSEEIVSKNEKLRAKKENLKNDLASLKRSLKAHMDEERELKRLLESKRDERKELESTRFELETELIQLRPEMKGAGREKVKKLFHELKEKVEMLRSEHTYESDKATLEALQAEALLLRKDIEEMARRCAEQGVDFTSDEIKRAATPEWMAWEDDVKSALKEIPELLRSLEVEYEELRAKAKEFVKVRLSDQATKKFLEDDSEDLELVMRNIVVLAHEEMVSFANTLNNPSEVLKLADGFKESFKQYYEKSETTVEKVNAFQHAVKGMEVFSRIFADPLERPERIKNSNPDMSDEELGEILSTIKERKRKMDGYLEFFKGVLKTYEGAKEVEKRFQARFEEKERAWNSFKRRARFVDEMMKELRSAQECSERFESLLKKLSESSEEDAAGILKELRATRNRIVDAVKKAKEERPEYNEELLKTSLLSEFEEEYKKLRNIIEEVAHKIVQ